MEITDGHPHPLGSTCDDYGTNFAVFSSVAERVDLCLFDRSGVERRLALPAQSDSIWHGYVPGVGPGQRYGYRVHGPWAPDRGHMCSPDMLLLDPHAHAVEGTVHWNDALFARGTGVDTAPFVPRSVVVHGGFDWKDDRRPNIPIADTVIYEVHVKGCTRRHRGIPADVRGTYAGLAHPVTVEHLSRLGITAVELLPVQQFIHRRHLTASFLRNYWGYDPVAYFAPHNDYAHMESGDGIVREFKGMVRALHQAGIEVIIDIVFNHTGEGGPDGPILVFRGLDNSAYYRLQHDDSRRYVDVTGTQNTLNTEHPHVRRMILDALHYWVEEMHVDGFRFDLTPALLREGESVNMACKFLDEIRDAPALAGVKLIAEPWDIGPGGYRLGQFPTPWSEWNDRFRDDVRDYWNGRPDATGRLMRRFGGSPDVFSAGDRRPQASVNYVTCHDGFTLTDLVSYDRKHNEANGEGNRDGATDTHSWNCGVEGPTTDARINTLRDQQRRNFMVTLLLAQGVPMLLGGDELGRTQRGNNNAYCQDNELSWFDWQHVYNDWQEFVTALVRLRQNNAAFRGTTWLTSRDASILCFDAGGRPVDPDGDTTGPPAPLQFLCSNPDDSNDFVVLFNPTDDECTYAIPGNRSWRIRISTGSSAPPAEGAAVNGHSHTLVAHSACVLSAPPVLER